MTPLTPPAVEIPETVNRLRMLADAQTRLRDLAARELRRKQELAKQLEELEEERRALLVEARISDSPEPPRTIELVPEVDRCRRELTDIDSVIAEADRRLAALAADRRAVTTAYAADLGRFLDSVFAEAAGQYGKIAEECASLLIRLAAIQEVMIAYGAGNTNGFERRAYLPGVRPGAQGRVAPLLDSDLRELHDRAVQARPEIVEMLRAAGFLWNPLREG